jgi:HEAT repeat protein
MARLLAILVFAMALALPFGTCAQEKTDRRVAEAIHNLSDKDAGVRADAARELNHLAGIANSPDERQAIPALIVSLKDSDHDVRSNAAMALGSIGSDGKTVIPALVLAVRDKDYAVREEAVDSLGRIGKDAQLAVPALVAALTDKDDSVRYAATSAWIGFGREARVSLSDLTNLLKSDDSRVRLCAAEVLAAIGPDARDAVPLLTAELKDKHEAAALEAAGALASIGVNQSEALPVAVRLLHAEDSDMRCRAAGVLGELGAASQSAVPVLTKALNDHDRDVRVVAAIALDKIADALKQSRATEAVEALTNAKAAMEQSPDQSVRNHADNVSAAAIALETIQQHSLKEQVLRRIRKWPVATAIVGVYLGLTFICLGLFWLWPISVLRINDGLRALPRVRLPGWLGGIEVSIPNLVLIGLFHYRDRVLDAWVGRNIDQARTGFELMNTVMNSSDKSEIPVFLDGRRVHALSAQDLRGAFAKTTTCVLIWGDDTASKTRLACQIGRWGMEADPTKRLRNNLMLPVLIEENVIYDSGDHLEPLNRTIRDKLRFDGPAPSVELVAHLLEGQRVLVIIHGLSELNHETQSIIRPDRSDFPAHASVITSRVEERFGGMLRTTITPAEASNLAPGD